MERNPQYLTEKYLDLAGSKPVEKAVKRSIATGEKGPNTKADRVERYLARLEAITTKNEGQAPAQRGALFAHDRTEESGETSGQIDASPIKQKAPYPERNAEYLKDLILNEYCLDTSDTATVDMVAKGMFESEKQIAKDRGLSAEVKKLEAVRPEQVRARYHRAVLQKAKKQRESLSDWLTYLNENQAFYPMWFQYFVVRELKKMGTIDTDHLTYTRRSKNTAVPFPDLNPAALAWVFARITNKNDESVPTDWYVPRDETVATHRDALIRAMDKKDFASLYAIATLETASEANKETIAGEWRTYKQGSDSRILESDLRNKGTQWCTAEGSASAYLQRGDAYVYFTKTDSGYTQPRLAIHMNNGEVSDVQGVQGGRKQEVEPVLLDIARARYESLPGGDKFAKKGADMKQVTAIGALYNTETKQWQRPLTKAELTFLYELDDKIIGFSQFGGKDERVDELRQIRKDAGLLAEDMLVIFDCEPNQIATTKEQVAKNKEQNIETKAYVGPLTTNIFVDLVDIEHIYTSFPEGRIRRREVQIGDEDANTLENRMKQQHINISDYARAMMSHKDFIPSKDKKSIGTVRLKVRDLGFSNGATVQEIYAKADELGLDLCPPDLGPHYRLQYTDQPAGEYLAIAMNQISVPDGYRYVFDVNRNGDGSVWLFNCWAKPGGRWDAGNEVVFALRK